jgi:hypothetical protein
MSTSATQSLARPSNPSHFSFLKGASRPFRQLGRTWKRCLPTVEFGRSIGAAERAYRRTAPLAAVRSNRGAATRLGAAVRAIGGGR